LQEDVEAEYYDEVEDDREDERNFKVSLSILSWMRGGACAQVYVARVPVSRRTMRLQDLCFAV
jgi:hypothetical protein